MIVTRDSNDMPTVRTLAVPNVSVRLSIGDDTSWAQAASPAPAAAPVMVRVASPMRVDILDALEAGGYGHPSVDQLIALRNAGIDGAYLKAMSLGKGRPSLAELIDLRNKGVMPDYSRGRQLHFGTNVPGNGIIELHGAGVITTDADKLRVMTLTSEALRRLAASSRTMTNEQLLQALKTGDQPK